MTIRLDLIDRAIGLGADVADWPEVQAARAVQERLSELEDDRRRLSVADPAERIAAIVQECADGTITADQMCIAAASLNTGVDLALVNRLFDDVALAIAGPIAVALRKKGDEWIEALRPVADRRAADFAQTAARLPNHPFHEGSVDAGEWHNLVRALDACDEVFDLAEALGARPQRWLHPEREPHGLPNSPHTGRSVAVMMQHAGCEAGVWTSAEVFAAAPPREATEPDELPPAA